MGKIEARNTEAGKGITGEKLNKLNREIAKEARKDKKQHLIEQFNEHPLNENRK